MDKGLKAYFPLIRERADILREIQGKPHLLQRFSGWNAQQQETFLDCCSGVRGVKILYDTFFKEVMDPDVAPELLEEFLSLVLGSGVKILYVLPSDSPRIADEKSLLTMDIVVQLTDGSIANVEVQKIGYLFPGQRSACYSADLLLRQYRRIRGERGKKFSYKDVKTVYTIVLFEKSPGEFWDYPEESIHFFAQKSDTGLELELLQQYFFIPLDIFLRNRQNKPIKNKLDAWLLFLSTDEPEEIVRLIEGYPEFKRLYEKVYKICQNMETVMGIFSEELLELDRNTVQYMMDEMQEEIDRKRLELMEWQKVCEEKDRELAAWQQACMEKREELAGKQGELAERREEIAGKQRELEEKREEIAGKQRELEERQEQLAEERRMRYLTLIRQVRNFALKGVSEEECAEMLVADLGVVKWLYHAFQENGNYGDSQIMELLNSSDRKL